jgi:purine-nucleoside phosphorylase
MQDRVQKALDYVRSRSGGVPEAAVVLGSGLGAFADALEDRISIPYGDIPGWPVSTAPGHAGRLVLGKIAQKYVAVMQGRVHYYEGYSMEDVVFPVRVFGAMGVKTYVATNAVGAADHALSPGDVVLLYDHINWMGANPLRGPDTPGWNPRFPDMTHAYDRKLIEAAERAAEKEGILVRRGVYMAFSGPSFETPAEVRWPGCSGRRCGHVHGTRGHHGERHGHEGLRYFLRANHGAGMTENTLTGEEVLEEMAKASDKLIRLLKDFSGRWNSMDMLGFIERKRERRRSSG